MSNETTRSTDSDSHTHPNGPLVSTQWLEDHLDDPSVVVLEVSIDPISKAAYASGHPPGARFVYWKDLAWHETDREFATPEVIAERLGNLGANETTTIALVGDPFQFAAYIYWVLTMAGQEHRCVLVDGGRRTWVTENRPLITSEPLPNPGKVRPRPANQNSRVGRAEILAGRNLYIDELLGDDGTLLSPVELEKRFDAVGATSETDVVTYCRLSHRGALAWFVLTRLLDRSRVRVYDGSWTEWGSIVGFPVER